MDRYCCWWSTRGVTMMMKSCKSSPHEKQPRERDTAMSKLTKKQAKEIEKLANVPDEDINTIDVPQIEDFTDAVRGRFYRPVKQQITLRIDADLLAWFRSLGDKYQTRINAALREYMDIQRKAR